MGTDRTQPLTLICNFLKAKIYTVKVDLSGLKILDIEIGLDWALLVAYNRGKMESVKDSQIYKRFENLTRIYDMVIGCSKGIDIQGRLFELALKSGYDCPAFIRTFMNSRAAAALDDTYDRLQWAGYTYRYWHYYTGESSKEIYKVADEKMIEECWLGFHTLDVEMAIDDLKEIYYQKKDNE